LDEVRRRLAHFGTELIIKKTSGPGEATRFAKAVEEDTTAVLAVGGDGTVREVAQGLVAREVPILIVPTGTENVIAQELGLSARATRVAETIHRGRTCKVDAGFANGRCFLIVAGVGFDGAVAGRLAEERRGHISHLSYLGPMLKTAWSYRFPAIRVAVDGSVVFEDRGLAFVGVMSRYSIGLRLLRDAVWDDGLFDVCVLRCGNFGRLCRHAVSVALGRHVESKHTIYRRGERVAITSDDRVPVEIDGEAGGVLPLELSVRRRAVQLMIPPGRRVRGILGS
jgi:YegS/Rv2252/BmrU family lipid kinase